MQYDKATMIVDKNRPIRKDLYVDGFHRLRDNAYEKIATDYTSEKYLLYLTNWKLDEKSRFEYLCKICLKDKRTIVYLSYIQAIRF